MWKDCICEKICYYTVFSLECKKNQLPESQKSKNIGDEGSFDRVSRSRNPHFRQIAICNFGHDFGLFCLKIDQLFDFELLGNIQRYESLSKDSN